MLLKPVVVTPKALHYEWADGRRYALVGKTSGYDHVVFTACDLDQA